MEGGGAGKGRRGDNEGSVGVTWKGKGRGMEGDGLKGVDGQGRVGGDGKRSGGGEGWEGNGE